MRTHFLQDLRFVCHFLSLQTCRLNYYLVPQRQLQQIRILPLLLNNPSKSFREINMLNMHKDCFNYPVVSPGRQLRQLCKLFRSDETPFVVSESGIRRQVMCFLARTCYSRECNNTLEQHSVKKSLPPVQASFTKRYL